MLVTSRFSDHQEHANNKDFTFGDDEKVSRNDAELVQEDLVLFTCVGYIQCRRVWQKGVGLFNGSDDRGGGSIAGCGLILLDLGQDTEWLLGQRRSIADLALIMEQ